MENYDRILQIVETQEEHISKQMECSAADIHQKLIKPKNGDQS